MAEHRHDIRVDCEDKCILHMGDLHYIATVKNISFGGALVNLYSPQPGLHTGDKCDISMDGKFIREYSCEVVREEAPNVALTFTGMHKLKAVLH
ncbi:MAG: PilZ domain-containing protein [Desulfuromonadaceae bacterium]|nr:PilZ domain-containing protein [Desulfuromonadaceae bacterium]